MFSVAFRILWRLLIFILGGFVLYVTIIPGFKFVHARAPFFLAALIIYCLVAYFVIPSLIRLFRLVIKPNHIPLYVTTPDGWPADPVNIAVIAKSEKHFIRSMKQAGWYTADKSTFKTLLKEGLAILLNRSYPTAPFSKLYLFDRPFDLGFQIPTNKNLSPRSRHHVRFWKLEPPAIEDHKHETFWQKHLGAFFKTKKQIWIGAAIDDVGSLGLRWRDAQITHSNDHDTNSERDYIITSLEKAKLIKKVRDLQAGEPFKMRGQTVGSTYVCDGSIKLVELRVPLRERLSVTDEA